MPTVTTGGLLWTMTPDVYLRQVLARHAPAAGPLIITAVRATIEPVIRAWAGTYLRGITVSGSNAKGTAVGGQTDLDLFISVAHEVPENLREIYWSLHGRAGMAGWDPRPQNVSIGVQVMGCKVDLVPARVQAGYINRHSLYRRKADTWTQTDVLRHIAIVRGSGRTEEIRLTKIWRALNGLEFPSLALELAVLAATRGRRIGAVADNFWAVLRYLAESFSTARLVDPANTANVISDDLTVAEKVAIALAARTSRAQSRWESIVW